MTPQFAHRPHTVTHPLGATAAASGHHRIRVVLADDHPAVRLGVRRLIDDQPDMRVVAEAGTAEEAVAHLEESDDVAVVDYHLDGGQDGLWLTRRLKRLPIPPRVLIYSAFAGPPLAVAARIAGADGLLGKATLGEELCSTIRRLAVGGQYFPAIPQVLADAVRSRVLPEDQAIFGMLLAGVPVTLIAHRLTLSLEELEDRRGMILRALTVNAEPGASTGSPLDYERGRRQARFPLPEGV